MDNLVIPFYIFTSGSPLALRGSAFKRVRRGEKLPKAIPGPSFLGGFGAFVCYKFYNN